MCVTKNRVPWEMLLNIRTKVNTGVDEGLKERGRGGGWKVKNVNRLCFRKVQINRKIRKRSSILN